MATPLASRNSSPFAVATGLPRSAPGAGRRRRRAGDPAGVRCRTAWDGQVVGAAGPVAATLGGADVGVAFTARPGTYLAGDWWVTQVRGSSADAVQTLTAAPPNGTPHYVAALAVVDLTEATVLSDCRPQFPPLTGVRGGCCTVQVQPSDVSGTTSLQTLLAGYANQGQVTVCLGPGTYTLSEPLVLDPGFSGITLQGCGRGVILQGPSQPGPEFTLGLIVIQGANSVTVRDVELSVPLVGFTPASDAFSNLPNQQLLQAFATGLQIAIGISATDSAGLTVENCTFNFPDPGQANVFGAGIYATGVMHGVEITRCTFQSASPPVTVPFYDLAAGNQAEPPYQLTFGYLQVALMQDPSVGPTPTLGRLTAAQSAGVRATAADTAEGAAAQQAPVHEQAAAAAGVSAETPTVGFATTELATAEFARAGIGAAKSQLLQDLVIERCLFQGITLPVFAMTQLGTMRIDKNTVRNSYGGFWFYSITDPSQLILFNKVAIGTPAIFQSFGRLGAAAQCDRIAPIATAFARVLPTTPPPVGGPLLPRRIAPPTPVQLARARQILTAYYARVRGPGAASEATAAGMAAAAGPAGAPPAAGTAKAKKAAKPARATRATAAADLPPLLGSIFRLPPGVAAEVIPVADTGTSVSPRLDVADCQVNAVIAESFSGAALIIADLTHDPLFPAAAAPGVPVASAVVHGSRMRTRFPLGEAALAFALAEATVTGNIIANEVAVTAQPIQSLPNSYSLSLFQMAEPLGALAAAVSGNILIDPLPTNLPQIFQPLNTIIGYSEVPTVTGLDQNDGGVGLNVTITGTGFTAATAVNFGPTSATAMTVVSDTEITATSPQGTGTVDITVITPAGTSATSPADRFTYQ